MQPIKQVRTPLSPYLCTDVVEEIAKLDVCLALQVSHAPCILLPPLTEWSALVVPLIFEVNLHEVIVHRFETDRLHSDLLVLPHELLHLGRASERLILVAVVVVVAQDHFVSFGVEEVTDIGGVLRFDFILLGPLRKPGRHISI